MQDEKYQEREDVDKTPECKHGGLWFNVQTEGRLKQNMCALYIFFEGGNKNKEVINCIV